MPKRPKSFRLSDEAVQKLAKLAEHFGLTETAVIEMLIREKARTERVR